MEASQNMATARQVYQGKYCGAVIVAAGSASRMDGIDKVMAQLCGESVIVKTVRAFQACPAIGEIVIVTRQDLIQPVMDLCAQFSKVRGVVAGGDNRQKSVLSGLQALSKHVSLVAIHDGARPLITPQLITQTVKMAEETGAAAPAIAVKDTVKVAHGGLVESTPDRSTLWAVQTPQVFDLAEISLALCKAAQDGAVLTDDCSAFERLGLPVTLVPGQEQNIKITTALDLKIARLLWEEAQ